jgi:hypothetical protein
LTVVSTHIYETEFQLSKDALQLAELARALRFASLLLPRIVSYCLTKESNPDTNYCLIKIIPKLRIASNNMRTVTSIFAVFTLKLVIWI